MDSITVGIYVAAGMCVLLLLGVRIAFATAFAGLAGLWLLKGPRVGSAFAGMLPFAETSRYTLLVIPLFVLMGLLAHHAGITQALFNVARKFFGHLPGGLAIATIFGCAGFAAVCGASTAAAAVMGRIALPEMRRHNYDKELAAGCVAAGGTMASMIPPSVLMVLYGFIAEQSVGKLLLAGFLPGLLEAVSYSLMLYLRFRINPALGPMLPAAPWRERVGSLRGTWSFLVLVLLVLGGMYTGVATPTEAAGLGAAGSLVLALPRLRRESFQQACLDTARTTAMIFAIVVGVLIFVRFMAFSGLPGAIAAWVVALPVHRYVILAGVLGLYFVLGMFLDAIGMMLLTVPIVLPAVLALGFNPIVFGVLVVRMIEVGLITPPIGLNVFVVKGVTPDMTLAQIFRGCGWFVLVDIINVIMLVSFPQIILFIPQTMQG